MDPSEIFSSFLESLPAAGPFIIILIMAYFFKRMKSEAVDKNINEVTFNELISELSVCSDKNLVSMDGNDCLIKLSNIFNKPRNAWKIKVFQHRKRYLNRLDYILTPHIQYVLIFIFALTSYILWKFSVPKEMCVAIDVLTFGFLCIAYYFVFDWFQQIKDCFNSKKALG